MFSLFLDLSDWDVVEVLRERQVDFDVEENPEMPGFFIGCLNCREISDCFVSEGEAHRAILAEVVGHLHYYEDVEK